MKIQKNTKVTNSLEQRKAKFINSLIEIKKFSKRCVIFDLLKFKYIIFYQIIRINNIISKK